MALLAIASSGNSDSFFASETPLIYNYLIFSDDDDQSGNDLADSPKHTLWFTSEKEGKTYLEETIPITQGEFVSLHAHPDPGYAFSHWEVSSLWRDGAGSIILEPVSLPFPIGDENPLRISLRGSLRLTAILTEDESDEDGDGLTAYEELVLFGTNPNTTDTSGDGVSDRTLVDLGLDPTVDYSGLINEIQENPAHYGLVSEEEASRIEAEAKTLVNFSTRTNLGEGETVAAGFVISGERKTVLVRAVGPKLADLGVATPLPNPRMKVFRNGLNGESSERIALVEDWKEGRLSTERLNKAMKSVGAFPLLPTHDFQGTPLPTDDSHSPAVLLTLGSGVYTVVVSSADGDVGKVLIELYEITE